MWQFSAVSSDSRAIQPGQLFVALAGPRFRWPRLPGRRRRSRARSLHWLSVKCRLRRCRNCWWPIAAWPSVKLGALNRQAFTAPVVAITGSSGKTTVKEMLASILREGLQGPVLATRGNLNNDLGAPLTSAGAGA